jgi:hypothetical protein
MRMPLLTLALNTAFQVVTGHLPRLDDVGTMQFRTGCTGTEHLDGTPMP